MTEPKHGQKVQLTEKKNRKWMKETNNGQKVQ
jgi:hypothetical protein